MSAVDCNKTFSYVRERNNVPHPSDARAVWLQEGLEGIHRTHAFSERLVFQPIAACLRRPPSPSLRKKKKLEARAESIGLSLEQHAAVPYPYHVGLLALSQGFRDLGVRRLQRVQQELADR